MNDKRADWAGAAVETFATKVFHNPVDREEDDTVLGDLLCNLRHWCDRQGLDFYKILARSDAHYAEETARDIEQVCSPITSAALALYEEHQVYINSEDAELPDCCAVRDELFRLGIDMTAVDVAAEETAAEIDG